MARRSAVTDLPGVLGQTCQGPRLAYLRQVPQAAKSGEHTQGGYAASPGGAGTVSNDDLVMITDALEPYRFLDTIIAISSTAGLPLLGRVLDTMSRAVRPVPISRASTTRHSEDNYRDYGGAYT